LKSAAHDLILKSIYVETHTHVEICMIRGGVHSFISLMALKS